MKNNIHICMILEFQKMIQKIDDKKEGTEIIIKNE